MKIKPLLDKVLLQPIDLPKSEKGIFLPVSSQEKQNMARVIAVGKGTIIDGKLVPLNVKENDTVIYNKFASTEIKVKGENFLIIKEEDIFAVIED